MKIAKNSGFCGKLLSENGFEAALATFCCYDQGVNASEAVQKFATDQKDRQKCSSLVQSITVQLKKLQKLHRKGAITSLVSFISTGNEITTQMGYSFRVVGLMPKYYLLARDTDQVSTFSLYKQKMSNSNID